MLKNYIKITLRNIKKYKSYSLVNIAGLAIGMTCCLLIFLWVQDELSWDRFHENHNRLFRVVEEVNNPNGIEYRVRTPIILAPKLVQEIPEIVCSTRSVLFSIILQYGEKRFTDDAIDFVDQDFFKIFSFSLLQGDPETALNDKHSIILTEKTAKKYFGDENPMGKTMQFANKHDLKVTGILADLPLNTHWHFDCLVPSQFWSVLGIDLNSWEDFWTYSYVLLSENASTEEVNDKISGMILKHRPDSRIKLFLQPFTDIHLHDLGGGGNIRYIYMFSAIAIVILLIACINFMNLTTARSSIRTNEIGIRKVIGAFRIDIVRQFLGESLFLSLIALMFALILVSLILPSFNQYTGKHFASTDAFNVRKLLVFLSLTFVVGLFAGSYPALFLSNFRPIKALKNSSENASKGALFRKIMVVTQFTLSITIIIGAIVISRQLHFMQNKDLGFDHKNLIQLGMPEGIKSRYEIFKQELLQNPNITMVAKSSSLPNFVNKGTTALDWEGKPSDYETVMHDFPIDFDFIEIMKMEIIQGRSFSSNFVTDSSAYILNEAAVKTMNLQDSSPIGKWFSFKGKKGKIIGVVKNFHHGSLHDPIEPLVLTLENGFILCIRIMPENVSETLTFIEEKWNKYVSDFPFEVSYLDDYFIEYYESEQRLSKLMNLSTFLAIFISCLGLFGLASFIVERRRKEIGVRKVLGASAPTILVLLSKDFTYWVLAANIIAWPFAWFIMKDWLQDFAYKIDLSVWLFTLAGFLTLFMALSTVSYLAVKAAIANPIDSIKYE